MGFFGIDLAARAKEQKSAHMPKGVPVTLLHRDECKACTLNNSDARSPKMRPDGSNKPLVYILTEAPTDQGDQEDRPLAGLAMEIIRRAIPRVMWPEVRFSSIIRTWPGFGKDMPTAFGEMIETTKPPTPLQIECCRPSVVRDIERTKPRAIFTFGGIALRWASGETHPANWQGRRMPVKIGTHTCWLYPFVDPLDLVKVRKWEEHIHENEQTFQIHMANICQEVWLDEKQPTIDTEEFIWKGVNWITGENGAADLKTLERHLDECTRERANGLDYETNRLRPYNKDARILTGSVSRVGHTLAWPFYHSGAKWTSGQRGIMLDMFEEYLYDPGPTKVAHQLPFEMEWSAFHFGKKVLRASKWDDSLSQAYVLNETQGMLSLESLTTQYFGFNIKTMSPVDRKRLDEYPVGEVLKYNGGDSKYHLEMFLEQEPLLEAEGLMDVYRHQRRRIPTLVLTQMQGVPIHQPQVKIFRDDFEAKLKVVEDEIARDSYVQKFARKYGHAFNEGSPHDVKKFLVDIKVPPTSTDEVYLSSIDDPLIPLILKRRKLLKVLGTYIKVVSEAYVDRNGEHVPRSEDIYDDGMLHPIISTTKVKTSRTSSEDPNVQNWPKRNENVMVRKQVRPGPGEKVYAFDYAGIQARNVAMESKDARLVKAFWDRYDIHTDFMGRMIDVYPKFIKEGRAAFEREDEAGKKLAKHYRHIAKNKFVFPTFFGATPKRVATDCGVPLEAGEEMQDEFFSMFPDIKKWQLDIQAFYKRNGYVTGCTGYRRRAPVGWNELINAPIQADEAWIVMEAMSALSELDYQRLQPTFEIHDDLTFIFPVKDADRRIDQVVREMVKPRFDWINVPLVVELSVGDDWCDLKHITNFENVGDDGSYVEFK